MKTDRTRVLGYVRVSTAAQAESALGLESQVARLRQYADLYDLELVDVVVDAGESAGTLDRPGLQRALALLDAGHADGLLVAKLDRLTRSVRDLGTLVEKYFGARFALLSVGDNVDTRSAAGRLVLNVLASVSQWEREAIGERTKAALQAKKARGERAGAVPFGFTADESGRLVDDVGERAVLERVRVLRAAGTTIDGIVATLKADGVTSRRTGRPFGRSRIAEMAA